MNSTQSRAALLAAVQQSPEAVAVHDRTAWVGLYSADGQVNDPVGSRPHSGHVAIGKFYDTFIAPNTIVFSVDRDFVDGMSVVRDLTLFTTMSTGVVLEVPMHLRYDLVEEGGVLEIRRLFAHWELPVMIVQLMRAGVAGIGASAKLTPQLLSNQGLSGALGFMRGFRRVGGRGKRAAVGFLDAASRGNAGRAAELSAPETRITMPGAQTLSISDFVAGTSDLRWTKIIAAGRTVTVSIERNGAHGVALFEFGPRNSIVGVRIFADS